MPYQIYNIDERTPLLKPEQVLVLPDVTAEFENDLNCGQRLSLEELLVFKDHPLWQPLRRALFCSFWLTLLLTLLAACLLSYMHAETCGATSSAAASSAIKTNYVALNQSVILAI